MIIIIIIFSRFELITKIIKILFAFFFCKNFKMKELF